MLKRLEKIPETRHDLEGNDLPISQFDIRSIAQVWGEEAAEITRYAAQRVRLEGGINLTAVRSIIPEGRDGALNEHELFRSIGNLMVWWEHQDLSRR